MHEYHALVASVLEEAAAAAADYLNALTALKETTATSAAAEVALSAAISAAAAEIASIAAAKNAAVVAAKNAATAEITPEENKLSG